MSSIQIEMFEVQLGAAVLLRFIGDDKSEVRVLADAGINAAGYTRDHVATKLKPLLPAAAAGAKQQIDCIIGTHYDQDHLAGLIEVAKQFTIKQAILPPVRRPRHPKPQGGPASASLTNLDMNNLEDTSELPRLIDMEEGEWKEHINDLEKLSADAARSFFEIEGQGIDEPIPLEEEERMWELEEEFGEELSGANGSGVFWVPASHSPRLALAQLHRIYASAHKGAIVARWLQKLVRELKRNSVPIIAIDITQGQPDYYVWDPAKSSFEKIASASYASSSQPKFTLLGPSKTLIAHHARKLPIGAYLAITSRIPLKRVTASNELSYVMVFEFAGQKILITGDAGCVDFWDKHTPGFYPKLLSALDDLQVVQIAHHAGNNFRFYDVLLKSKYKSSGAPDSFLLLSHADSDHYRPSSAFSTFVQSLGSARSNFQLLTTSNPIHAKVASYATLYCPATTPAPSHVGDIRLSFQGVKWMVDQHLVQV